MCSYCRWHILYFLTKFWFVYLNWLACSTFITVATKALLVHTDEDPDNDYSVFSSPKDYGIDLTNITRLTQEMVPPKKLMVPPPLGASRDICSNNVLHTVPAPWHLLVNKGDSLNQESIPKWIVTDKSTSASFLPGPSQNIGPTGPFWTKSKYN